MSDSTTEGQLSSSHASSTSSTSSSHQMNNLQPPNRDLLELQSTNKPVCLFNIQYSKF